MNENETEVEVESSGQRVLTPALTTIAIISALAAAALLTWGHFQIPDTECPTPDIEVTEPVGGCTP